MSWFKFWVLVIIMACIASEFKETKVITDIGNLACTMLTITAICSIIQLLIDILKKDKS